MATMTTVKYRAFLTHLSTSKYSKDELGFNLDGSKTKKKAKEAAAKKKTLTKVDDKHQILLDQVDQCIRHLIKMRQFPYVMKTEKKNMAGMKVINQFYVDENGLTINDNQ